MKYRKKPAYRRVNEDLRLCRLDDEFGRTLNPMLCILRVVGTDQPDLDRVDLNLRT
jgi:hypothetical protein